MDKYTCEYCLNNSGIKDSRGGCVSCGATLVKISTTYTPENTLWFNPALGGVDGKLPKLWDNRKLSVADIARRSVGLR